MRISKPSRVIPALFTTASIVPNSATTAVTNSSAALKSAASDWYPFAFMPYFFNSSSKAFPFSTDDKKVNATLAPCSANLSATALPIPREAPVINAVFPSNNFIVMDSIFDVSKIE